MHDWLLGTYQYVIGIIYAQMDSGFLAFMLNIMKAKHFPPFVKVYGSVRLLVRS